MHGTSCACAAMLVLMLCAPQTRFVVALPMRMASAAIALHCMTQVRRLGCAPCRCLSDGRTFCA